jgi:hypothetical protein
VIRAAVAGALAALAAPGVAAAADPPVRSCSERAELGRPVSGPGRDDVRAGPVFFYGAKQLADRPAEDFRPRSGETHMFWKLALIARAGTRVTVVIPSEHRSMAGLGYRRGEPPRAPFTVANGGAAVRFRACRRDQRAFSYDGTVGGWTAFTGGFLLPGAACVPIEVRERGRVRRVTLAFGADC